MALVTCPDCGKEHSDAAPACPNCGRPNRRRPSIARAIVPGIIIVGVISWLVIPSTRNSLPAAPAVPPAEVDASSDFNADGSLTPLPKEVTAQSLASQYEANEIAADSAFKGKMAIITGKIDRIGKDVGDDMYVTLGSGRQFELRHVQAFFNDSMKGQLAGLHKGQSLRVQCRVSGLMMNVLAKDCVIL